MQWKPTKNIKWMKLDPAEGEKANYGLQHRLSNANERCCDCRANGGAEKLRKC